MQCLIKKVVVTGEHVDIYYIFPFDQSPQVYTLRYIIVAINILRGHQAIFIGCDWQISICCRWE